MLGVKVSARIASLSARAVRLGKALEGEASGKQLGVFNAHLADMLIAHPSCCGNRIVV